MRRRPSFRPTELKKAIDVSRAAGLEIIGSVISENGEIRLQYRSSSSSANSDLAGWDDVLS